MDLMLAAQRPQGERAWMWDEVWEAFGWCEPRLREEFASEMSEGRTQASLLKLAALLHDVAKPQTRERDADGRVRFFGHADLGAEIAARAMRRLRFSAREVRFVRLLVAEHLRPVQLSAVGEAPTRRALYRFYRALGEAVPAVLFLALADAAAARGESLTRAGWRAQASYMASLLVRSVEQEGIMAAPRLLTGRDIMSALGLAEGPLIGRLLEALAEAQAAGEVADRDGALALVGALARQESSPEAAR
jgi:poly(A) polymerase